MAYLYSRTLGMVMMVVLTRLLLSMTTVVLVIGQQLEQQQPQQQEYTEEILYAMSEEQLENLCIQRGFELLKDEVDPTTGEVYQLTHQDYVEAAMKCLAIEQEMNELFSQYPELAEELEEEIKKMEAENAAKQAELDEIQSHLESSRNSKTESTENDGSENGFSGKGGTAFVSKSDRTFGGEDPQRADSTQTGSSPIDEDDFTISAEEPIDDSDNVNVSSEVHSEPDAASTTTSTEVVSSADESQSSSKEDFSLSILAIESLRAFVKHAKDDVNRIIELLVPVMKPLLTAGDVMWRQIKALFVKARDAYHESSSINQSNGGDDDETEATKDAQESYSDVALDADPIQ